jgi:hypothetical protein
MIGVGVLAALAIVLGMTQGTFLGIKVVESSPPAGSTATPTANPLVDDPAPKTLLPRSAAEFMAPTLRKHYGETATSLQEFWSDNERRVPEDAAFVSWAAVTAEPEPTAAERGRERTERARVDQDKRYTATAGWLSSHGCRDVWASYANHDAKGGVGVTVHKELGEVLDLAAQVATAAHKRYNPTKPAAEPCASAVRTSDPSCQCSYPSAAVVQNAAARMYLGKRLPRHDKKYAAMEKQVDAAGLFQRRELPSDVSEGTRLGYMVGRYFLITRGYGDGSEPTPTPTPTR